MRILLDRQDLPVLPTVEAICCDLTGNIQTLGIQRALGRPLNESG
jgi:hypothetical protein